MKIESTVSYPGVDIEDTLNLTEGSEVWDRAGFCAHGRRAAYPTLLRPLQALRHP
jgi:hypothetical protein